MNSHPLCCDCEDCMNRGGGVKPAHRPYTYTTLGRPTTPLKKRRRYPNRRALMLATAYRKVMARRAGRSRS